MYMIIVLPLFLIVVLSSVQSWLWKSVFIAIVGITWYLWGTISVAVAVAFILGIALKNSLARVSGSKI